MYASHAPCPRNPTPFRGGMSPVIRAFFQSGRPQYDRRGALYPASEDVVNSIENCCGCIFLRVLAVSEET